jgi:hypothetical protein
MAWVILGIAMQYWRASLAYSFLGDVYFLNGTPFVGALLALLRLSGFSARRLASVAHSTPPFF